MKSTAISMDGMRQDALYVNWHLLDGCNHDCEYSHEPPSARNERFSRETVLLTAYNLLSLNRPEYIFHLYGGEPTIHPYFQDLVAYLATGGRNVRLVLDTNGLRSLEYYRQLLRGVPAGRLCVHIDVHCKYLELEPLALLVAHIVEGGQFCRVTLNYVPEYADKARLLYEKLGELQGTLAFAVDVAFPLGGAADWLSDAHRRFAVPTEPVFPAWTALAATPAATVPVITEIAEGFSCLGVNSVQVAPDGVRTLGLYEKDVPFVPQVMENALLREDLPPAPSFPHAAAANAWLAAFRARTLRYELDGGPVRHPLHTDMDDAQRLRSRLKRLRPTSAYHRKLAAYPEIWQERRDDVLRACDGLSDEDSRDVLLRRLKAQATGDSEYLARSPYAQFAHPALADMTVFPPNDRACRRMRLAEATPEAVAALCPRLTWYRPALEVVLPPSPLWLDTLLTLRDALPDYRIFLGQHGVQTVLYAAPSAPRKRYLPVPPRTLDGQPLVSVILPASGDAEAVTRSLESVLAQHPPRYEVVVVQDADADAATVDAFVRRAPWQVRAFRFDEPLSLCAARDAGLDMAQGEYVCFLRCGDALDGGTLTAAVAALEKEQADVALCAPSSLRSHVIDGPAALTRFLTGQLGGRGTRDKVYRAAVIRDHAVTFADLPGLLEDDLFNLPVFHFAAKVCCLPGALSDGVAPQADVAPEGRFTAFLTDLDTMARFRAAHDMPGNSPEVRAYALRLFKDIASDFTQLVRDAENAGDLDAFLSADVLQSLTRTPVVLQALCEEYVAAFSVSHDAPARLLPAPAPAICRAYGGASEDFGLTPPLSVVVTVEDGAPLTCLEHLVREDCALVECVVIDNATSGETAAALEDFADMYPHVRLFRMESKALSAQCRNAGLDGARGASVTFMESDDAPDADFVTAAAAAMSAPEQPDAALFGVQRVDADGVSDFPFMNGDARTGADAVAFFFEKGMRLDLTGMVFRRERLDAAPTRWNPLVPENNADFVLRALADAAVVMRPETACVRQERETAPMAAYVGGLESCNAVYALLERLADAGQWSEAALSGLRQRLAESLNASWLPLCAARLRQDAGLAFTEEDVAVLRGSALFLRTLCSGYARGLEAE